MKLFKNEMKSTDLIKSLFHFLFSVTLYMIQEILHCTMTVISVGGGKDVRNVFFGHEEGEIDKKDVDIVLVYNGRDHFSSTSK